MDDINIERLMKLDASRKRQIAKQNEHISENYKRVSIVIRKEIFEKLKNVYPDLSMNGYINGLIEKDLQSKKPLDFGDCPF